MTKVRLKNTPEDFTALGINPSKVEPWEDGKRDNDRAGAYEWWYFDIMLDDGKKIVIHFNTKDLSTMAKNGCQPTITIEVTLPDGTTLTDNLAIPPEDAYFGKGCCDVKYGPHSIYGDLKEYSINVSPVKQFGAELKLTNLGTPWRPGTGYYVFGENEEQYFTWLCVVPRGKVTGTLTIDGNTFDVTGYGYHDHQWGNINHLFAWNNWLWARQNLDSYNILIFDIVTQAEYGYKRLPMIFIQDENGNIVYESLNPPKYEVFEEYLQNKTGKYYPKCSKYTFEVNDKHIEYTLDVKNEISVKDQYGAAPPEIKEIFDQRNLQPTYGRYIANGTLEITEGGHTSSQSGELIYEFVYMGKSYKEFM